jgi:AcrR family transcriptional regulator
MHAEIDLINGADRAAAILRVAAKLFAAHGYGGASMQDIANDVGITKASLYHFFRDKDEIHNTVVIASVRRLLELVEARTRNCSTAAEKMEGFARAHAQHIAENRHFYFAAAEGYHALTQPEIKRQVQRLRDGYEETLRMFIRQGVEDCEFRELDVKLAARALISCLNWMARWWRPDGPQSAEDVASDYVNLLIAGFRADPAVARP